MCAFHDTRIVHAPRWQVSGYGECSHSCGGGTAQRRVECVQDIGMIGQITRLSDTICRGLGLQKPSTNKLCNVFNCPPAWHAGPWSQVILKQIVLV